MDILETFIESGKRECAIDVSIPTETFMSFLGAVADLQAGWGTSEEHRVQAEGLYKLVIYGLNGR